MTNLNHPDNLKYSKSDEWVLVEGDQATIGITDYAQDQLGDIVYIELPWDGGTTVAQDTKFGDIESVKATSELVSPISGTVVQANATLKDKPELINDEPYTGGWMLKITLSNPNELNGLLNADAYLRYLEGR
jgi:glycine cleavage system H protein